MIVYSDSDIIDLEWLSRLSLPEYTLCHSFEDYAASTDSEKIAFTTQRLHCTYDVNCSAYSGFEDKINKLSAISNLVFTIESELHNYHWQMWEQCHHDNVYWVVPGQVNNDMNKNLIFWGDWFKTTSNLYKELPNKLAEITYGVHKPKMFDALLGSPKPHREFVAKAVVDNNLQDQFIMPYGGQWTDKEFYAKDYFIWEPGVEIEYGGFSDPQGHGTAGPVIYCGVHTGLSRVIPIQVFNETAHSIVAETDEDDTLSFFSEKTAKPMIARRVFVAFSGYRFLHNLRAQGFKTFGSIIDESYDLIENNFERYAAAFEQVKKLCAMDQVEVYNQVKSVLDHNYELAMNRDWTSFATDQIQVIINSAQR